jgi:hypothetical protein
MRPKRWLAAAGVLFAVLSVTAPALAEDYVGNVPPRVGSADVRADAARVSDQGAARALVVQQVRTPRATTGLALTGADIVGLTFLAAISLGTGVILVRRARPAAL